MTLQKQSNGLRSGERAGHSMNHLRRIKKSLTRPSYWGGALSFWNRNFYGNWPLIDLSNANILNSCSLNTIVKHFFTIFSDFDNRPQRAKFNYIFRISWMFSTGTWNFYYWLDIFVESSAAFVHNYALIRRQILEFYWSH